MADVQDAALERSIAREPLPTQRSVVEKNAAMGHFPLISWRSIFAGFFVTLLVGAVLLSLSLGLGGLSLTGIAVNGVPDNDLALRSAVCFLVSGLLALLAGSYYAARISNFITSRIGAAQGLVIAAFVLLSFIFQIAIGVGATGSGMGGIVGALGGSAVDLTRNPQVQNVLAEIITREGGGGLVPGGIALRSEPDVIAQGLAARLLQGDEDGARNYLAYQTGISREEADARLANISAQLQDAMQTAAVSAARAVSGVGWSLFGILFLGTLFSALGGALGAKTNFRRPLARDIARPVLRYSPSYQL